MVIHVYFDDQITFVQGQHFIHIIKLIICMILCIPNSMFDVTQH